MSQQRTMLFKHEDEEEGTGPIGPLIWMDTKEFVTGKDEWLSRAEAKKLCEQQGAKFEEF